MEELPFSKYGLLSIKLLDVISVTWGYEKIGHFYFPKLSFTGYLFYFCNVLDVVDQYPTSKKQHLFIAGISLARGLVVFKYMKFINSV